MRGAHPLWRFVGRDDVFAEQQADGSYYPVRRELTDEDLIAHEQGEWTIGTYTITPVGTVIPGLGKYLVNYVVFDIDTGVQGDLTQVADAVEYAVDPLGSADDYACLVLEESGRKGWHVWLFFAAPVEAYRVRQWLEDRFWPRYLMAGGTRALEVFPKQDTVRDGGFGNLTKVPGGVHQANGKRSKVVGYRNWPSQLDSVRGMGTSHIPQYADRRPRPVEMVTAETPTGVLLTDGPVARFLRGEVQKGERNNTFNAFFFWTAWNVRMPKDLAWEWWDRLNDELADPETDIESARKTMESAYARPPADAAVPRPTRGPVVASDNYRSRSREERVAALKAQKGTAK